MPAGHLVTLVIYFIPSVFSLGNNNIDFLVEGELLRYTPQVKVSRLNLHINIDFNLASAITLKNRNVGLTCLMGKISTIQT